MNKRMTLIMVCFCMLLLCGCSLQQSTVQVTEEDYLLHFAVPKLNDLAAAYVELNELDENLATYCVNADEVRANYDFQRCDERLKTLAEEIEQYPKEQVPSKYAKLHASLLDAATLLQAAREEYPSRLFSTEQSVEEIYQAVYEQWQYAAKCLPQGVTLSAKGEVLSP